MCAKRRTHGRIRGSPAGGSPPAGELGTRQADRGLLAAACCLPLLEFGENGWRGWSQLIVYPEAFRVSRSHVDAAGVLHEWDDELIGESWETGPLILSVGRRAGRLRGPAGRLLRGRA